MVGKIRWMRKVFFKRFIARLHNLFRIKEMWDWEYESCNRCGSLYRAVFYWEDETWWHINGRYKGCLCGDCAISLAQEKQIKLKKENIEKCWVFDPDNKSGGCFDIIKPKK